MNIVTLGVGSELRTREQGGAHVVMRLPILTKPSAAQLNGTNLQ